MKKLPNQIKQDLRQLRAIKPDAAWLVQNKEALLASLPVSPKPERSLSYASVFSISFKQLLSKLAWQPVGITLMVIGIIGGPSLAAVNAAKGSLPGDALYPVKRSLERARVSMTFSQAKKAQIEVDLVANRLHELQRLTKEQAPSPARQQKITIAIEELKKDTAAVKTRLDATKQDTGKTSQQTVALAKIIDAKTSGYQETLQQTIAELDEEAAKSTSGTLTQAISTVQDVSINALDVLVNKASEPEGDISPEDLKARVEKQLDVVKKAATALQTQVAALELVPEPVEGEADTAEPEEGSEATTQEPEAESAEPKDQPADVIAPAITTDEPTQSVTDSTETEITEDAQVETLPAPITQEEIQTQIEKDVLPLITYAEELIKLKDFAAALETLDKANRKIDELSKSLESLRMSQPAKPEMKPEEAPQPTGEEAKPVEGSAPQAEDTSPESPSDKPVSESEPEPTEKPAQTTDSSTNTQTQ